MEYASKSFKSSVRILVTTLMAAFFVSGTVLAGDVGDNNERRTAEKAREAVDNAGPDDWHTLASAAERCIKKDINLAEAKAWLEKSIEIRKTPYNLAILGDYYMLNQIPEKGLEYYVASLRIGFQFNINYRDEITHSKMMKVRKELLKRSNS